MKPRVGRKYTFEQIQQMHRENPGLVIPGHVLRKDADGLWSIVPDSKAAMPWSGKGKALETGYRSKETIKEMFPVDPIQKRTPQERIASLADKLAEDMKAGRLTQEHLKDIEVRSWARGEPVSGEAIKAVAAAALQMAENKNEAAERKKVTRTAPSD